MHFYHITKHFFAFFFFKQKCAYFSSRKKILKRKSTDTECPDNEPTKTQICKERLYLPEPPKARKIIFYFTGNRSKNTSILLVAWISLDYDNSDVTAKSATNEVYSMRIRFHCFVDFFLVFKWRKYIRCVCLLWQDIHKVPWLYRILNARSFLNEKYIFAYIYISPVLSYGLCTMVGHRPTLT